MGQVSKDYGSVVVGEVTVTQWYHSKGRILSEARDQRRKGTVSVPYNRDSDGGASVQRLL